MGERDDSMSPARCPRPPSDRLVEGQIVVDELAQVGEPGRDRPVVEVATVIASAILVRFASPSCLSGPFGPIREKRNGGTAASTAADNVLVRPSRDSPRTPSPSTQYVSEPCRSAPWAATCASSLSITVGSAVSYPAAERARELARRGWDNSIAAPIILPLPSAVNLRPQQRGVLERGVLDGLELSRARPRLLAEVLWCRTSLLEAERDVVVEEHDESLKSERNRLLACEGDLR